MTETTPNTDTSTDTDTETNPDTDAEPTPAVEAIAAWTGDIHQGDVRETLRDMPADSVNCVMTSPPYYGLRDYGEGNESLWGADPDCDHEWTTETTPAQGGQNTEDNPPDVGGNASTQDTRLRGGDGIESGRCAACGAWRGQLGLEPSLDQFIANIVEVAESVRHVLRPDGSFWLNLGDSYASSGGPQTGENMGAPKRVPETQPTRTTQFPAKSKMLVPHRIAIALQDAGWLVRNDVVWHKPNPMPESVTDRLSTTFEFVFHLTPNPSYHYDLDAIREPYADATVTSAEEGHGWSGAGKTSPDDDFATGSGGLNDPDTTRADCLHPGGKNPGDVFEVPTKAFPDAHFAVYPPTLCETPIKATCPEQVCASCGTPYERDIEREIPDDPGRADDSKLDADDDRLSDRARSTAARQLGGNYQEQLENREVEMNGWLQTCECATDDTAPGIVLDPFAGAGTTCLVGKDLGRRFVGVELNPEYVALAQKRVGVTVSEPDRLLDENETALTDYTDHDQSNDHE